MDIVNQQTFKSKSSAKEYVATLYTNGEGYCTCPAWKFKRPGQARTCGHLATMSPASPLPPPEPTSPAPAAAPVPRWDGAIAEMTAAYKKLTPVTPVAAQLASGMTQKGLAPYQNDAWRLEPKFDGHRAIIRKRGSDIYRWSRPNAAATPPGPHKPLPAHIVAALQPLPDGVYDAELMAPTGKAWDVTRIDLQDRLFVVLFDILEVHRQPVTGWPQWERRAVLEDAAAALPSQKAVHLAPSVPVSQEALDAIYASGGEGAILKRQNATYAPGSRSDAWLKVVPTLKAVLTITGFAAGSFGPYSITHLKHEDGTVTQIKTKDFATLRQIEADGPAAWIGKRLLISYKERIKGGAFRHPMWSGVQFDHVAADHE